MNKKEILVQLYHESAENYRHHTNLAWAIGAILVPIALYLLYLSIEKSNLEKMVLGMFGISVLIIWHIAYDRLGWSAKIEGDSLIKIEKILNVEIKPHDEYKTKLNQFGLLDLFYGFKGFGKFFSFWFIRWVFISLYSFIWVYIWNFNSTHSINYIIMPITILFALNLIDLKYISYSEILKRKKLKKKRPIISFIGENIKLSMVIISIVWFFYGEKLLLLLLR